MIEQFKRDMSEVVEFMQGLMQQQSSTLYASTPSVNQVPANKPDVALTVRGEQINEDDIKEEEEYSYRDDQEDEQREEEQTEYHGQYRTNRTEKEIDHFSDTAFWRSPERGIFEGKVA